MVPDAWDEEEAYEPEDLHYLEDEDYEAFVRGELGSDGRPRGTPPIGLIIGVLVVVLLVVALLMAR